MAPADDAALLTALAVPARGFGAGGVAVKYLKQAAAQRGGVGALLAAAHLAYLAPLPAAEQAPATARWAALLQAHGVARVRVRSRVIDCVTSSHLHGV